MIQLTHIKKKETYKSKCYYFLSLQLLYLHNPNRKSKNVLSSSLVLIFFFNISRKTSLLITFNIIFHNNTLWYLKRFTILSYINCFGCRCWDCLVSSYECNSHAVYFAAKYQRWELQVGRVPYNTVTINVDHGSEYELRKAALISHSRTRYWIFIVSTMEYRDTILLITWRSHVLDHVLDTDQIMNPQTMELKYYRQKYHVTLKSDPSVSIPDITTPLCKSGRYYAIALRA